jgi:hypothetical protein
LTGANEDTSSPYPSIIKMDFNENDDPVTSTSLTNAAPFAQYFDPTVVGTPSEATYELISGSNYSFNQGITQNSSSLRARIEMEIDKYAQSLFKDKITLIWRFSMVQGIDGALYVRRTAFSSEDATVGRGVSFSTGDTQDRFRCRIGNGSAFASFDFITPITLAEDNTFHFVAFVWEAVNNGADGGTMKCYYKSAANSQAFQELTPSTTASPRYIDNGSLLLGLSRRDTGASMRPEKRDYMEVILDTLTEAQILTYANTLDPS